MKIRSETNVEVNFHPDKKMVMEQSQEIYFRIASMRGRERTEWLVQSLAINMLTTAMAKSKIQEMEKSGEAAQEQMRQAVRTQIGLEFKVMRETLTKLAEDYNRQAAEAQKSKKTEGPFDFFVIAAQTDFCLPRYYLGGAHWGESIRRAARYQMKGEAEEALLGMKASDGIIPAPWLGDGGDRIDFAVKGVRCSVEW